VEEGSLCVYGQRLPSVRQQELLYWSLRRTAAAVLICTDAWSPLSRILVLNPRRDSQDCFLATAAQICRAFGVAPVVLTVAQSEKQAWMRQRQAQEVFAGQHTPADFDFFVGRDVGAAIALEAQWRRCSHAFAARQTTPSWRLWLRGEPYERVISLSGNLTILSYADMGHWKPVGAEEPKASKGRLESFVQDRKE
jgi:hypothetical protein